jgi:K+-transporting ATPase ATPase C chain
MEESKSEPMEEGKANLRPIVGIALVSLLVCGLIFPLVITGVAQVVLPYQANGEIVQLNGHNIGSNLIDNVFTLPIFFHARPANATASGVDPDITLQDAYDQIPRISNATGLPAYELKNLIDSNVEGVFWVFGSPYLNVLRLNVGLINMDPSFYDARVPALHG